MMLKSVRRFFFVIAVFAMGQCVHATEDDNTVYIKYAKEIVNPFIEDCEKKYELDCIGTGGGFAKNVEEIAIKFISHKRETIEDTRLLEVTIIEESLKQVNTHEKIRPFLIQYPFKPNWRVLRKDEKFDGMRGK